MEIILTILLIIVVWKYRAIRDFFGSLKSQDSSQPISASSASGGLQETATNNAISETAPIAYIQGGSYNTGFQDSLKAASKSKVEVEQERKTAVASIIQADVQDTIEQIKIDILAKAKIGDYEFIGGKNIVTVTRHIPSAYYHCREIPPTYAKVRKSRFDRQQPAIEDIESHLKFLMQMPPSERGNYNIVQQTRMKNIIEPTETTKYESFLKELMRLASIDGITVRIFLLNDRTKEAFNFPCEIPGKISWMDFSLVAECQCAIPEKYSSDVPVRVEFDTVNHGNDYTAKVASISIDAMEGHIFEGFCAHLLRENRFSDIAVTKGSGDQGIDIIAYKDGIKYGIQCKCYSSDIGNSAVQEAFSGKTYYKCHVGAVLTNRYFTRSAKELAETNGILLWDRTYLLDLIEKAHIKVTP